MRLAASVIVVLLVGCGGAAAPAKVMRGEPLLYDRIGGRDAIMAIVDDLLARPGSVHGPAARDPLIDQLCELSGGPCKYTGKPMRDAHDAVTEARFAAFLAEVDGVLATRVGATERRELLAILRGLQTQIVETR